MTTVPCPGGSEVHLSPGHFHEVFAAGKTAAMLAVAQRPADVATLTDDLEGPPGWRSIPCWTLVTTKDRSLPTTAQRFMASRAGSVTAEEPA
jgi:hypothetical protein